MAVGQIVDITKKQTTNEDWSTDTSLLIESKGSIAITSTSKTVLPEDQDYVFAARYSHESDSASSNNLTLQGKITVSDKATPDSKGAYGIVLQEANEDTSKSYTAYVNTGKSSSIGVTSQTSYDFEGDGTAVVAGIYGVTQGTGTSRVNMVVQDIENPMMPAQQTGTNDFLSAVTVTYKDTVKTSQSWHVSVYGIGGINDLEFNGNVAAAIKATGTSNEHDTEVYGIEAQNVTVAQSITKDITASGSASGLECGVYAGAISVANKLSVAGNITSTISATATSKKSTASAYAIEADQITITGNVTKALTATATGVHGVVEAFALWQKKENDTQEEVLVSTIGGDLTGKVTAKATSGTGENSAAKAYGLAGLVEPEDSDSPESYVSLNLGNVKGAVSATATGTYYAESFTAAYAKGIVGKALSIDSIQNTVTAKATTKAGYGAQAYGIQGTGAVKIENGATKSISATASSLFNSTAIGVAAEGDAGSVDMKALNSVSVTADCTGKDANGWANATAKGVYSGTTVNIESVQNAITAKATSKTGYEAHASGIQAGGDVTIDNGVAKGITATATSLFDSYAYGIVSDEGDVTLGDVKCAISATGTASSKEDGWAMVVAITGKDVTINSLQNTMTAKATAAGGGAVACGIAASETLTVTGNMTKKVTVTASSKSGSSATGLEAAGALSVGAIQGAIAVSATTTDKSSGTASATGISSEAKVDIGSLQNTVTATATTAGEATAYGIQGAGTGDDQGVAIKSITKNVSASATSKVQEAIAIGIGTGCKVDLGTVTGGISATANASSKTSTEEQLALATGINGSTVNIESLNGAVTAKATSAVYEAEARAIKASDAVTICVGTGKDISATATGATNATAQGIYAVKTLTIGTADTTVNAIAGKVTAKATANGSKGSAEAVGLYGKGGITIHGNVTKEIAVTAAATHKESDTAEAVGMDSGADLTLDGDLKSKITVSATSKASSATAYGIRSTGTLSADVLGTINATATGNEDSAATGIEAGGITAAGNMTGSISATCKKGSAIAMYVEGEFKAGDYTATLTVTATGGVAAYGMKFGDNATLTLTKSKITAKCSEAANQYALFDASSGSNQDLTLNSSTVTGAVNLGGADDSLTLNSSTVTGAVILGVGEDKLTLTGKSKITGNVDMGTDGNDSLIIQSGSQIKGEVSNKVGSTTLQLFDLKSAGTTLCESKEFWDGDDFALGTLKLELEQEDLLAIKVGKTQTFSLLKDTDTKTNVWTGLKEVELIVDNTQVASLNYGDSTGAISGFDYTLTSSKDNKTLQLTVKRTA